MGRRQSRPGRAAALIAGAGLLLAATGCAVLGIPTKGDVPLAQVDLPRMYGGWYVVATIPNALEHGIIAGYDVFSAAPGGNIYEDYTMKRGGFDAKTFHTKTVFIAVLPNSGNADWRVRPVWPLSLPFQVVYVDPQYRYALFGEQDRKWGWVYSRTQTVPDADYAMLMGKFRDLGWDPAVFRKVVQTPDQVGAPGFWSDGVRAP